MFDQASKLPTISTQRLDLRWLTHDDVDALFTVFSDPAVMRFWSRTPMLVPDEATQLLEQIHADFASRTLFQWGIERREDRRVIGTFSLYHVDQANRRAEIGYALGSMYWKRGYMREVMQAMLGYCFRDLNLHRLEADIHPHNRDSARLLELVGFERDGYLRERWIIGGELQDSALYGLIGREWEQQQASR